MYKVHQVPLHRVQQTWDTVSDYIKAALEYANDDYTIDQVRLLVATGVWSLFIIVDSDNVVYGAITVQFNQMPNTRVAFVTAIGGKTLAVQNLWEQFVKLLKDNGATDIEGVARPSVARLWSQKFGFKEKYTIVGVKI